MKKLILVVNILNTVILIGMITVLLTGCGQTTNITSSTVNQNTVSHMTTVQAIVSNENQYRESVGQELLIPGLSCYLYTVPTTTTQIVGATLTGVGGFEFLGKFNQPNDSVNSGLNILPTGLRSTYQSWFIVRCYGSLVIDTNNWHSFDLTSDDGSNLYIDGLLINNDGLHGAQTKFASKYLKYGIHSFELDFFQAAGNQALILNEDGQVMDSSGFYH